MWRRPVLTPNIKYDSARDFVPIGPTAHSPAVIVARKDFPAKDLREFVAYLKQNAAAREAGPRRYRRVVAHGLSAVHLRDRSQADARRLPRHRAGDERPDRRSCRFLLRAIGQRLEAGHRRRHQGLRHLRRRAARRAARRADRQGGRHQLPDEHLGRHLRAGRHAAGRRWRSSPMRSTRRSTTAACASASTISVARCPPRPSAARRRSTRYVKAEIARWAPILKAAAQPAP